MSTPQPKTEAEEVLEQLAPRLEVDAEPLTDFEAKAFLRDLKAEIPRVFAEDRGTIFHFIGNIHHRRKEFREALDAARNSRRYSPDNTAYMVSEAVNLFDLGRLEDAVTVFSEALAKGAASADSVVPAMANLAEAFHRLGRTDDAERAFESAVRAVRPDSRADLYMLAVQAAEIGREEDAAEFYARYLTVRQGVERGDRAAEAVIQETPHAYHPRTEEKPALAAALKNVLDRWNSQTPSEFEIPARTTLEGTAWTKFAELTGLTASR